MFYILRRLRRIVGMFLGAHVAFAGREARRDLRRFWTGLLFLLFGLAMLLLVVAFACGALVVTLHDAAGLSWGCALLVVAAVNVPLGLALMALGYRALRRPWLVDTRAVLKNAIGGVGAV